MNELKPTYYHCPNKDYDLEVKQVIEAWNLHKNAYLFNVIKYVLREDKSKMISTRIEDLRKATTYINMEIERLEKEVSKIIKEKQDGRK